MSPPVAASPAAFNHEFVAYEETRTSDSFVSFEVHGYVVKPDPVENWVAYASFNDAGADGHMQLYPPASGMYENDGGFPDTWFGAACLGTGCRDLPRREVVVVRAGAVRWVVSTFQNGKARRNSPPIGVRIRRVAVPVEEVLNRETTIPPLGTASSLPPSVALAGAADGSLAFGHPPCSPESWQTGQNADPSLFTVTLSGGARSIVDHCPSGAGSIMATSNTSTTWRLQGTDYGLAEGRVCLLVFNAPVWRN